MSFTRKKKNAIRYSTWLSILFILLTMPVNTLDGLQLLHARINENGHIVVIERHAELCRLTTGWGRAL
jgi:aspartate aminotransferase-like enzyme